MSTTEARVQAAPAVQTSEILGSTQEYQQYSTRKYYEYSLYTLPKFCQHSKYSSCPSVNIFCKQMGMELSKLCTNGRIILHTPSVTANVQSTPRFRSTNGRNAASTCSTRSTEPCNSLEILEVEGVSTVSNPDILRVRKYLLY